MRHRVLLAACVWAVGAPAWASTLTFTNGGGNGNWSNPLNWSEFRTPTAGDDVVIPAGVSLSRVDGSFEVRSVSASSVVVIDAPLTLQEDSTFGSLVQLGSDLRGMANVTIAARMEWRSGSLAGAGLVYVEPGATVRVSGPGQPVIEQVVEVFGTLEVDAQTLEIARPVGLLRVADTGVLRLMNAGRVFAADVTSEAFVISGLLASEGASECRVDALFLNASRVHAGCPLRIEPAPSNLGADGVLSGGTWETSGAGEIGWSDAHPATVLDAGTTLMMSGMGASPSLYGNLRRIDGELLVDAKDPAVVVRAGASNPTVITGRVRVAGDSRISFSTGFVCEPTAILELAPSYVQPPITALNSVGPAATLDGTLEVLMPPTAPEGCGEFIALITGAGSFDAMTGDFDVVTVPPVSLDQRFAYTVERFLGSVIESVVVFSNSLADWNLDGGVDSDDVITYFEDWDRSEADVTGDGGTDGDDIIYFFSRWDQGC